MIDIDGDWIRPRSQFPSITATCFFDRRFSLSKISRRHDTSTSFCPLHRLFPLQNFLSPHLLFVISSKVADDDWDGERNHEYPTDTTRRPNNFTPRCSGINIAVPNRRHGDCRPPERLWNAAVVGVWFIFLGEVGKAGENKDGDREEHHEKSEFFVTLLECISEGLKPGGMASKFQDSQDAHDPEDLNNSSNILELFSSFGGIADGERHVIWKNGEKVDDVEGSFEELTFARWSPESDDEFECEPTDTDSFDDGEVLIVRWSSVLVLALERRKRVDRQTDRRRHHEQDRYYCHDLKCKHNISIDRFDKMIYKSVKSGERWLRKQTYEMAYHQEDQQA